MAKRNSATGSDDFTLGEGAEKNPRDWKQWQFHTIEFPEIDGETMYVTKNIIGTRKNEATGKEEEFEYKMRYLRGQRIPNVPLFVLKSFNDQIETRYDQKKKTGKSGGNIMVPKRVKVRSFVVHESYDEQIPDENAPVTAGVREDAPDYQE